MSPFKDQVTIYLYPKPNTPDGLFEKGVNIPMVNVYHDLDITTAHAMIKELKKPGRLSPKWAIMANLRTSYIKSEDP